MSEQGFARPYTLAFRLAALVAIGIAIYHAVALFYPTVGKVVYGAADLPGYPAGRRGDAMFPRVAGGCSESGRIV